MTQYLLQVSVVYCVWCYVRHDVASILCVKINLPGDEAVPAASECRVLCVVLCVVCTVCMVTGVQTCALPIFKSAVNSCMVIACPV